MQVDLAVLAADVATAKQLSSRLSDTSGFTSFLASKNFSNVSVTRPPAVFDASNSKVLSRAGLMSKPGLFLTAMLATAAVASILG